MKPMESNATMVYHAMENGHLQFMYGEAHRFECLLDFCYLKENMFLKTCFDTKNSMFELDCKVLTNTRELQVKYICFKGFVLSKRGLIFYKMIQEEEKKLNNFNLQMMTTGLFFGSLLYISSP